MNKYIVLFSFQCRYSKTAANLLPRYKGGWPVPLGPSDRALSIMTEKRREEDTEQRETEKDVSLHIHYCFKGIESRYKA